MAIATIPTRAFSEQTINFRNIIINGDMSIAQRGTSATGLGNGDNGYHTCDRWRFAENGSPTWEFTQTQSTDVPTGQGFAKSLKMDCTTADTSLATNDMCRIQQRFEGQNVQYLKYGTSSAQSTTVSFWVKSNKTGNYNVSLENVDQNRIIGNTYTINSADTWEKKTITFAGDTSSSFDNDNANSLTIYWGLLGGTDRVGGDSSSWGANADNKNVAGQTVNLADSTSNEWYITGVQLEAGTTASDFEFLPRDVNLERCQRYYFLKANHNDGSSTELIGSGLYYSSSIFKAVVPFPITMRTTPSLDQASGTDYYEIRRSSGADKVNDFSIQNQGKTGAVLDNNSEASGTSGVAAWVRTDNANAYIAFDAEL